MAYRTLLAVAVAWTTLATALTITGRWVPIGPADTLTGDLLGLLLIVIGTNAAVHVHIWSGSRRRARHDPLSRNTRLVEGPFALVRHPMLFSLVVALIGVVLVVPSPQVLGGAVVTISSCLLYARRVVDPALLAAGAGDYTARTGRLIPGVGRLRPRSREP
jgi:protein-S-isoprenylcysteine O-methyltransferase Ste14